MHHSEQQIFLLVMVVGGDSGNILDATSNTIFLKFSSSLLKDKREGKILLA